MLGNPFGPLAMKIAGGIILALLIAAIWLWIGWDGAADARDQARLELAQAEAEIALLRKDAALKEQAAEERQADTAEVAQAEKEMVDAIKDVPDEGPDAVRVALGCERLRRAGRVGAGLPAICRSGGGAEAGSDP